MTSSWFFLSSLNNDARSTAQSELLRQFFRDRKNTLRVSTTHHQNYVFDRTDLIKVSTLVLGRKAIVMSLYEKRERQKEKTSGDASNFFDESPLGKQRHLCDSQWRNNIFKI